MLGNSYYYMYYLSQSSLTQDILNQEQDSIPWHIPVFRLTVIRYNVVTVLQRNRFNRLRWYGHVNTC